MIWVVFCLAVVHCRWFGFNSGIFQTTHDLPGIGKTSGFGSWVSEPALLANHRLVVLSKSRQSSGLSPSLHDGQAQPRSS